MNNTYRDDECPKCGKTMAVGPLLNVLECDHCGEFGALPDGESDFLEWFDETAKRIVPGNDNPVVQGELEKLRFTMSKLRRELHEILSGEGDKEDEEKEDDDGTQT